MKNVSVLRAWSTLVFCLILFCLVSQTLYGQGVPRIITYQGSIDKGGEKVSGEHQITATIYGDALAKTTIWQGTYATFVTDGIFAVALGAGKYKLPDTKEL